MIPLPRVGAEISLALFVGKEAAQGLVLRLYTNDHTPADEDSAATYREPSGGGYAPKPLAPSVWAIEEGRLARYPLQRFEFTGPVGKVFGYYVTDAGGRLRWSERFADGAVTVRHDGDEIKVTPKLRLPRA